MKKEIFPKCPSCGNAQDETTFIKCKSCGFVPESTERKWKESNMGKQRSQPKWIAESKNKSRKK